MSREIHIFGDWEALGQPQRMGLLRADQVHGREIFSYEYDPDWLASNHVMTLDPELQHFQGPQYLRDGGHPNFGLFLDSSPDRWGQLLMKRRESIVARNERREPRRLFGSDFLVGVHDEQRMGGLRLKETLDGEFVSDGRSQNAPPWARLRDLEDAAWRFQMDATSENDQEAHEWLRLLIVPGSSIGGARPKAGVCDEHQDLWIAKFPGRDDEFDIGAWEMVAHRLAKQAGINVAEATAEQFGRPRFTFMTKRFDRKTVDRARRRLHFASAMTMLGYADGADFREGASYLEVVEFLIRHGADVDTDLQELWRRIVFSICVSNTDDHLRNHGFLLQPDGWKLSPAYDINPNPHGTGLHLNISEDDNSLNLELALSVAPHFRLGATEARAIIDTVKNAVREWPTAANKLGISHAEQQAMKRAFRVGESEALRSQN